jgi:hypothetical protein
MQDFFDINGLKIGTDVLIFALTTVILVLLRTFNKKIYRPLLNGRRRINLAKIDKEIIIQEDKVTEESLSKISSNPQLQYLGKQHIWEFWKPNLQNIVEDYSKFPRQVIFTKLDMEEKLYLSA